MRLLKCLFQIRKELAVLAKRLGMRRKVGGGVGQFTTQPSQRCGLIHIIPDRQQRHFESLSGGQGQGIGGDVGGTHLHLAQQPGAGRFRPLR